MGGMGHQSEGEIFTMLAARGAFGAFRSSVVFPPRSVPRSVPYAAPPPCCASSSSSVVCVGRLQELEELSRALKRALFVCPNHKGLHAMRGEVHRRLQV